MSDFFQNLAQGKSPSGLHRITIVGGGAGGLELAVRLGKTLGRRKKAVIMLIDAGRTHLWKPLLHQVAAGTLDRNADERDYFALAIKNHFHFRLGRMEGLSREKKEVVLAPVQDAKGKQILPRQHLGYDTLVMALGSQTNDFGTPGAAEHCIMLVSIGDYSTIGSLNGMFSSRSLFIEGAIAKVMYWSLHKHHQVAVNGWFYTWLSTWAETIGRVRNPRIKLH